MNKNFLAISLAVLSMGFSNVSKADISFDLTPEAIDFQVTINPENCREYTNFLVSLADSINSVPQSIECQGDKLVGKFERAKDSNPDDFEFPSANKCYTDFNFVEDLIATAKLFVNRVYGSSHNADINISSGTTTEGTNCYTVLVY